MSEGTKHDSGKPRMSLLDPLFLTTVAQVLTFGVKKYEAHNWRGGLEVSRLMDAAMRHLNAFNDGEDLDPESGISHLGHAACNLMFALRMLKDRPDLDDRYKKPEPAPISERDKRNDLFLSIYAKEYVSKFFPK